MKRHGLLVLAFCGVVVQGASAADGPSLADLGWISGHWCGGAGGERIEEYWMSPDGGVLLGLARALKDGQTTNFEYSRIVLEGGVPAYVAQPNGGAAVAFKRTAGGRDWARFENLQHDFPTRVEYRRQGDALHAEIGGPGEDGKEQVIAYDYVRCPA